MNTLASIQQQLKVAKNHFNDYGKYHYRKLEDILEALKPLLSKDDEFLFLKDEITLIGDRYYVTSTAYFNGKTATASAREPLNKKGMDEFQITGAAISYARKYALSGLFALDDNKDPDELSPDNSKAQGLITQEIIEAFKKIENREDLKKFYNENPLKIEQELLNELAMEKKQELINKEKNSKELKKETK